ncbi:cytochrome P450 [Actinomadura fibrosa]|uniref:Cytochrome P450 n=1 Tax=Actinomadura fibrosa TaxID=111802 RepID=A0ABW2XX22_9ACTN|nr:cytochrome P450 [Actinomadura fibrosa]
MDGHVDTADGWTPRTIDLRTPNVARMYDYYLGGKDNYQADRDAAAEILRIAPFTPRLAHANRAFLRRATRCLVEAGVRQFLDIGTGLPTRNNVHEVAHALAPGARVVYVDNDPVVAAHGRALISGVGGALVLEHDLRDPRAILDDPAIRQALDFDRPVGLMLLSVLHCLTDEEGPHEAVATLLDALAPGSHVVVSHITGDDDLTASSTAVYDAASTGMTHRGRDQLLRFFDGCTLLDPGLVYLDEWRPDADTAPIGPGGEYYLCGVARKDAAPRGTGRTDGRERPVTTEETEDTARAGLSEIVLPSGQRMRTSNRHADVRQMLTDARFSRDLRRGTGARMVRGDDINDDRDSLLNMDPPRHTRLRRIVAGAFAPRQVAAWRPRVTEITRRLAAEMAGHGAPADLVQVFVFPLPVRVICELLGVPEADRDRFRDWAEATLSMSNAVADERARASREFRDYVRALIAERRRTPGEALLDELIAAHDGDDVLTEAELVSLVINLITAGHETTANLIATAVHTLVTGGLYGRLAADAAASGDYTAPDPLVEETLRHATPAQYGMPRVALEDVDLPSGRVERGETVLPLLAQANRDPEAFPAPAEFDPARDGAAHLTFGHGAHFCLGAGLARLEVQTALTVLLTEFPRLELAVPPEEIPWREATFVTGPRRLPVRW